MKGELAFPQMNIWIGYLLMVIKQLIKILLTLFVLLFVSFTSHYSFAEIVTLDDGRIVNLNDDGTFTIISEDTTNFNNDIRKSIISLLNLLNIKYESIDFINDSSLILKNITSINSDIEGFQFSIEKLEINNLNKNYFKDLNINSFDIYKGKIFDKIILTNLNIKGNEYPTSIGKIEIDKFDLKEMSFFKDPKIENIFSFIDNLSVNKIIFKEIEAIQKDKYFTFGSLIINDLRNSNIGNLIYTDYKLEDDEGIVSIDIFEVEDLKLNNKNLYKIDWTDKPFEKNPIDVLFLIDSVKKISCIGCYTEDYKDDLIIEFAKFEFSDFKMENISDYNIPVAINLIFEGVTFNASSVERKKYIENILNALNYDQLKFDFKLSLDWNTVYSNFSFDLLLGVQDGFDLNLSAKFEDVYKDLVDFNFNEDSLNSLMEDPKFKNLEISIQDKSLTDRLLRLGASNLNMTKIEFVNYLISEMNSNTVIENSFQSDFLIIITNFIQQPDKITISINPLTSLSYADIFYLVGNPDILFEQLNLKIK